MDISVITNPFADVYEADMAAPERICRQDPFPPRHRLTCAEMVAADRNACIATNGAAYVSEGEVLFDVPRYEANGGDYGALSGRSLDDLLAGRAGGGGTDNKRQPRRLRPVVQPSKPGDAGMDRRILKRRAMPRATPAGTSNARP